MFDYIVYDSTTYETATSYISTTEYAYYVSKSIYINHEDILNEDELYIQNLLVNSTFVLDNLIAYNSDKLNTTQNTQFPRNYELERVINNKIKLATAYIASQIKLDNFNSFFVSNEDSYVRKQKIDVLEVEYAKSQSKSDILFNAHPLLRELLSEFIGGSCLNITVNRV